MSLVDVGLIGIGGDIVELLRKTLEIFRRLPKRNERNSENERELPGGETATSTASGVIGLGEGGGDTEF